MKKGFYAGLLLVAMVFASSCTKNYTCTCNYDGGTEVIEYENTTRDAAEQSCSSTESVYQAIDASASCTLD